MSYGLGAGLENLVLRGANDRPGGVQGTGNSLDNHLTSEIPATPNQINFLDGGGGNDTLTGGAGAEFFSFSATGQKVVDGGGGFDWVSLPEATVMDFGTGTATGANGSFTFVNIEAVAGSSGSDRITAGNGAIQVLASAGDDTLIGGAGNDTLSGDATFDAPSDFAGNTS